MKSRYFKNKNKILNNSMRRAIAILALFLMAILVTPSNTKVSQTYAATAGEIQNQINQIQNQINQNNKDLAIRKQAVKSIKDEISLLDAQIYQTQLQINATQSEINLTNVQVNDISNQITSLEAEVAKQKKILNEYLAIIYEDSQTSVLEQIAGANSFSDFVDRAEYLQTMQLKIRETVAKIRQLKQDLESKKKELQDKIKGLENLKMQQISQRQSIDNDRAYQSLLLANAKSEQDSLQGAQDSLYSQRQALSRQYNEVTYGGSTSYPFGVGSCVYSNDGHGYYMGQCVSYAAWWRAAHGNPVPDNMGNAKNWADNARTQGLRVDSTPSYGAVMVFPNIQPYGHVAIVENVSSDGTITISDMNWDLNCGYRKIGNVDPNNYRALFIH